MATGQMKRLSPDKRVEEETLLIWYSKDVKKSNDSIVMVKALGVICSCSASDLKPK
jgi:hypothetical protein